MTHTEIDRHGHRLRETETKTDTDRLTETQKEVVSAKQSRGKGGIIRQTHNYTFGFLDGRVRSTNTTPGDAEETHGSRPNTTRSPL